MVRAIFFDFYSVWLPDTLQELLDQATALGPEERAVLAQLVDHYYHGVVGMGKVADTFRYKLQRTEIDENVLTLRERDISPNMISFMRALHGHFVKLGILGNLGTTEWNLLKTFNTRESLFEVIVCPISLGVGAPLLSREVFDRTLKLVNEVPADCIAVSGNNDYLRFASTLGMVPVKYDTLPNLMQRLAQLLSNDMPSVSP